MAVREIFSRAFADAGSLLTAVRADALLLSGLADAADLIANALQQGNKVLACGNGGSMADAMHFAEEFTGRFRKDRDPLPVLALSDPTHITCVANDYGYEHIFSRGVKAFGKPGDVLVLLSTSGNSKNLWLAADAAKQSGMRTIGFLGRGGGPLAPKCDLALLFPGETADRIQELHMLALHALIEAVEGALGVG